VWGVTLGLFQLASSGAVSGFWEAIFELWPLLLAAAVAYFCRQSPSTPHGLESLGKWLHEKPDTRFPLTVLRDQAVKAFFLPLMISFAYSWLARTDMKAIDSSFGWYLIPLAILYLVDTVFGTIGYLSTSQRVQAHIRSSDSTLSGWAVALSCYPPFFFWLESTGIVNYHSGHEWQYWLGKTGFLAYIWGGAILVLSAIYAWATVIFGIRFSNLTNRGIVTNGPFKYSKHPAYISKNISWWLMSMPFVSTAGVGAAAIHCGALLVVNLIYCLRAKTEERHLMSDANYRAYALWIAEHGLLAKLRNWFAPKRCVVVE